MSAMPNEFRYNPNIIGLAECLEDVVRTIKTTNALPGFILNTQETELKSRFIHFAGLNMRTKQGTGTVDSRRIGQTIGTGVNLIKSLEERADEFLSNFTPRFGEKIAEIREIDLDVANAVLAEYEHHFQAVTEVTSSEEADLERVIEVYMQAWDFITEAESRARTMRNEARQAEERRQEREVMDKAFGFLKELAAA